MHVVEAATKMVSLCPSFYQDSFHKDEKGQISQENKIFFRTVLVHHLSFTVFVFLLPTMFCMFIRNSFEIN